MSRLLQVVVFSNDTTVVDGVVHPTTLTGSLDVPQRMALLRELVANAYNFCQLSQAQSLVDRSSSVTNNRPLYLFVAPEYLLAKSGTAHVQDLATRDRILGELKTISDDHPDMIIVPGTITWKKPQSRTAPSANYMSRSQKAINRVLTSPLVDTLKTAKLNALRGQDPNVDPNTIWLAYSTAYVFYNGQVIHKYSKMLDVSEVNASESEGGRVIFIPGDRSPYFSVDGVDFALEICGEHDSALRAKAGRLVDVHVIVSATVGGKTNNYVARSGGWVIHADAYKIGITQVARGATITGTDVTAPGQHFTAAQLGGQYLDSIKQAEARIQAAHDAMQTNYARPMTEYLKRPLAKVGRASAQVVQQTLLLS